MARRSGYNTNLASEYFVMSMLCRKGRNAMLTVGNKKSIDILVQSGKKSLTIDVKGIAGTTLWPMDNFERGRAGHFIVLVSYLGKIDDHSLAPEVYVVPSTDVRGLIYRNPKKTRKGIFLATVRRLRKKYRDRWGLIR
jgi:hypothetical protein